MKHFLFISITLIVLSIHTKAQELNCNIQVTAQAIQGSTIKQVTKTLQTTLFEFMNNRKWTNHVFDISERIECNILINITEQPATDTYKAELTVQSNRPVYNASYNSVILNHKDDDIQFSYIEHQTLEFSETSHLSNLTSILAYYAYIIIGMDYDSFSLEGGSEFYRKAEDVVNYAQNAAETGWKSFDSKRKNRYWLVENLLNEKYSPAREFLYTYHRKGLDVMVDKTDEGRAVISESLKLLEKAAKTDSRSILMRMIFTAKSDEFVDIFSKSFGAEKNRVYELLKKIDPSNSSKYQKIVKG